MLPVQVDGVGRVGCSGVGPLEDAVAEMEEFERIVARLDRLLIALEISGPFDGLPARASAPWGQMLDSGSGTRDRAVHSTPNSGALLVEPVQLGGGDSDPHGCGRPVVLDPLEILLRLVGLAVQKLVECQVTASHGHLVAVG